MMTLGPNPTNINPQASPWGYTASSSVPSIQEQQQSRSIIDDDILNMSVDEILSFYKHDTGLLKHILTVKAQDDQRKTTDELRQLDEARQKFGYDNAFGMVDYNDVTFTSDANKDSMTINNVSSPVYNNMNNASPIFSESSFQTIQHYDPQDISPHFDLLLSPPPPTTMMIDHAMNFFPVTSHQPQEQASSVATSMDLPLMPYESTTHHLNFDNTVSSSTLSPPFDNIGQFMSPSPNTDYTIPDVLSTVSSSSSVGSNSLVADLSITMRPVSCSPSTETIDTPDSNVTSTVATSEAKKKSSSSKHKRRHLSTTSLTGFSSSTHVIRWAATKKKRISRPIVNINQEPQEPLDHKKVMEALRNKLTRTQPFSSSLSPTLDSNTSSTPPPTKATPPTSPRSPPVDTQPSTSVLYLDLKSNPSSQHRPFRHQ